MTTLYLAAMDTLYQVQTPCLCRAFKTKTAPSYPPALTSFLQTHCTDAVTPYLSMYGLT